jgi:hypothetical protein
LVLGSHTDPLADVLLLEGRFSFAFLHPADLIKVDNYNGNRLKDHPTRHKYVINIQIEGRDIALEWLN